MDHGPYYRAAIPDPRRILGLKLRPFSLGHLLLLNRVESAFVTGQRPSYGDLALSVFICSQKYEDGIEALDSDDLQPFMRKWQRKLCGECGILYWIGLRKSKPIDLPEKCKAFSEYLKDGCAHPDFCWSDENTKSIAAPIEQIVRVKLLASTNLTETEIMNRPWALSLWDYLTLKVFEGQIDFVDSDEIDEAQKMAEKIAERMKEKV